MLINEMMGCCVYEHSLKQAGVTMLWVEKVQLAHLSSVQTNTLKEIFESVYLACTTPTKRSGGTVYVPDVIISNPPVAVHTYVTPLKEETNKKGARKGRDRSRGKE